MEKILTLSLPLKRWENFNKDKIDEAQLKKIECHACPGAGSCGGMYTANTMASAIEALGMSLPSSSSNPAVTKLKLEDCHTSRTSSD